MITGSRVASASTKQARYCGVGEDEAETSIELWLHGLPPPGRWAIVGAAATGMIGAIAGLVIGLRTYAPAAPFTVVELGMPAAILGGLVGLAASE